MMRSVLGLFLMGCLTAGAAQAADDPLLGKWKVDPSRSTLIDEMRMEAAGPNRFLITFGPGQVETVVADGREQPGLGGTTISLTPKGPGAWEFVRKYQGRMTLKARWTLSKDGKSLRDDFTQYLPDGLNLFSTPLPNGSSLVLPYVYERTAGTAGLVGVWDSPSATISRRVELQIQPGEGEGLSLKRSDEPRAEAIRLDGADHPGADPNGAHGDAYAARRVDALRVEITDKLQGKTAGVRTIELSADRKTLTLTERLVGQNRPKSVLVFERT